MYTVADTRGCRGAQLQISSHIILLVFQVTFEKVYAIDPASPSVKIVLKIPMCVKYP